ncbi:MAG: DUF6508 domain-containing protein [Thiolinea sp.]
MGLTEKRAIVDANFSQDGIIEQASVEEICSYLTLITRKERINDGLFGQIIEDGTFKRIVDRLETLNKP